MANDIIGSMFGVDHNQIAMQNLQRAYQQNAQMASQDPLSGGLMANVGANIGMLGAKAMGLKTREEQVAENRQQIAQMITRDDPDSYLAAAQKAQELGDTQAATALVQEAADLRKQKQTMSLQASQEKLNQERLADLASKQTDLIKTGQLTEDGKKPIYTTQSGTQFTLEINPETGEQYRKQYSGGIFVKPSGTGAGAKDVPLTQDEADFFAKQMLSGDKSAVSGMARNKQGMAQIKSAMVRIAKEQDISPQDLAIRNTEFAALGSSERTVGTQTANVQLAASEAHKMADITLGLFSKIDNTNVKSINDFKNMVSKQFGGKAVVELNASLNALINSYARAINPRGVATVSDKDHAREMLNSGFSEGQGAATIAMMKQEMQAALESPVEVSAALRAKRIAETKDKNPAKSNVKFLGFE